MFNKFLRKRHWSFYLIWTALILFLLDILFPYFWFSPAIHGQVIDKDTQKPVPDAIVVFRWTLRAPINTSFTLKQLALFESKTDASGKYVIPQWGPRFSLLGHVSSSDPLIIVYHRQYFPIVESNVNFPSLGRSSSLINLHEGNEAISLKRYTGRQADYEDTLFTIFSVFNETYFIGHECNWEETPHFLIALHDLKTELEPFGKGGSLRYVNQYQRPGEKCADPNIFFKKFK